MATININYNLNPPGGQPFGEVGQNGTSERGAKKSQATNNFYGGFLNPNQSQDRVAQRREKAHKDALKVVMDTFKGELKVDDDQKRRAEHMEKLETEIGENQAQIRELSEAQEELKKTYGISEDSEEQQDLELLKKRNDIFKGKSTESLTKEEMDRLAEISKNGLTEYQSRVMNYENQKAYFEKNIQDARKEWHMEQQTIRAVDEERLKHHYMVDAEKNAEKILESADREILGMMMQDAVETQEEKLDEIREEAEQRAEKSEEHKSEEEEIAAGPEAERLENVLKGEKLQERVEQILQEELLTEEDLKGMIYDELL